MPSLKRRQFLQAAGSTLSTLCLSQIIVQRQGDRYGRVLAQNTPRKLALLVGVNDYPTEVSSLRGCLTDVQMQQELLVHRFGFSPSDLVVLTNAQATRQAIIEAFEAHLIQQALPGDIVVFYFAGHGSLVKDPDPIPVAASRVEGYNSTLVTYDARQGNQVNDIMGKTLFLLVSALQSDQVTVMLDSCYSGGGTRGALRVRAVDVPMAQSEAGPGAAELATQATWLARLGWSPQEFKERRTLGPARGVVLGSTQGNQKATEAAFGAAGPGQFYAGAFTYALTRYLWQQPGSLPLERVFVDLARSTRDVANSTRMVQSPLYEMAPGQNAGQEPLYFSRPQTAAAEAVVLGAEHGQVTFWLGGISSQSLEAFESGAIFSILDTSGHEMGQVEQTRREGLVGYGMLMDERLSMPPVGTLLREQVRGIPTDLTLRVGLDPSLEADLDEARSLLAGLNRIEPVAMDEASSPHYLLGRMTEESRAAAAGVEIPGELGSFGLFTVGLAAIADSFGAPTESIAAAIERLNAQLKLLLAGRVLRSVLNSDTSNLKVGVTVQPVNSPVAVGRSASRGSSENLVAQRLHRVEEALRAGTEIVVNVTNGELRNLYVAILAIGSAGDIAVLYPTDWGAPESASLLEAGQSLAFPRQDVNRNPEHCTNPGDLCLRGSGYVEILTLASTSPLRNALRGLQQIAEQTSTRSGVPLALPKDNPVDVIETLLGDLDRATRSSQRSRNQPRHADTTQLAALSTMLHIVED